MSTNRDRRRDSDDDDNTGKLTIDSSGNPSVGIGGRLGIDTVNGDVTYSTGGGMSIDTGA